MMETTQQTSTKQDILQYLLKGGQGTALELAESLDISPQAIRRHLKDLDSVSVGSGWYGASSAHL
jgi:DeoR family suf operon transcriptional repressor